MDDLPSLWVILAIVVIVVLFLRRFGRRTAGKRFGKSVDVEGDLLRACGGDRTMVERLIQHELDRREDLSRTGAALMALSRLRDDNR